MDNREGEIVPETQPYDEDEDSEPKYIPNIESPVEPTVRFQLADIPDSDEDDSENDPDYVPASEEESDTEDDDLDRFVKRDEVELAKKDENLKVHRLRSGKEY